MLVNKVLILVAHFVRYLNLPLKFKHFLFLFTRKRNIKVRTNISFSGAKIDLSLGEFMGYWTFMDRSYEEDWIRIIAKLAKDKVLIDVGANIGIYPLSLFKIVKKIYAFEPELETYKTFVNNLKINNIKNVTALKLALSNKNNQKLSLFIKKENMGLSSLKVHYSEGMQLVNTQTLDRFIQDNAIKDIGLIKIDVEGSELDVLTGASYTLKKMGSPVLIELNGPILKTLSHSPVDIYRILVKNRYRAFQFKNGVLTSLMESDLSSTMNCNVLFVK